MQTKCGTILVRMRSRQAIHVGSEQAIHVGSEQAGVAFIFGKRGTGVFLAALIHGMAPQMCE